MGYIHIDRKLFDHFLWKERRSFSRFEAWLDLIQLASYNATDSKMINGVQISFKRGQYPISYSYLAERWVWSTNRVRGYMRLLKNNKQITTESTSIITIITLCNYELYNTEPQSKRQAKRQADSTTEGQADHKPRAGIINKEIKEIKYNAFYDLEIESHPDEKYIAFVKFLFGENDLRRPFTKLINLNDQIGYDQYLKLKALSDAYGSKIYETCRNMDNYTKKTYSSFYTTLYNWMKPKFESADVRRIN